ncbi:hypothetical protein D0868_15048 [Hortaea werneckii]|uniref:Uncharacterized protein n=1 Tax=Hortaea werneckii TaxID=91943 RepID=A0A3M6X990_HORWE|nr:hypothetical protein D0868_15048 [Hortaea werneckii]
MPRDSVQRGGRLSNIVVVDSLKYQSELQSPHYVSSGPRQDNSKWTFGQLIAVTIWAPILIEFLYSAIFGVEEAQEHRLIAPFKVTKQEFNPVEDNSKIPLNNGKQDTFYRRLDSPSEMELPLVYVQDGVSAPSGQ